MTTHPVGTADLVKRLREDAVRERLHALEQDFWHEEILIEAADRIEQLEAALTLANAATAAAYEVVSKQLAASRETFCYASPGSDEEFTSLLLGFDTAAGILSSLATPDQTAALDRLIAEAVNTSMQGVERWEIPVQSIEHCLDRMVVMSSQEADTKKSLRLWLLSLAASKKGGV